MLTHSRGILGRVKLVTSWFLQPCSSSRMSGLSLRVTPPYISAPTSSSGVAAGTGVMMALIVDFGVSVQTLQPQWLVWRLSPAVHSFGLQVQTLGTRDRTVSMTIAAAPRETVLSWVCTAMSSVACVEGRARGWRPALTGAADRERCPSRRGPKVRRPG